MDESAKLSALQKAYAEIIMNVSKEAACRVLASEKKRLRLQQELSTVKDEGLRLLLRLKQILDDKTNEAEMNAISQRKRIDELEAQLDEAEDIVEELRGELREARAELAKVAANIWSSMNRTSSSSGAASTEMIEGTARSSSCRSAYIYAYNQEFSARMMKQRETEVSRGSFTQKIQAFGGNLFGKLSLPGKEEHLEDRVQKGGKNDASCTTPNLSPDQPFGMEEDPDELEVTETNGDIEIPKSFQRKRKRTTRYLRGRTPMRLEREQTSDICFSKSALESHCTRRLPLDTEQISIGSQHPFIDSHAEPVKPCSFRDRGDKSKLMVEAPVTRQGKGWQEALIFSAAVSDTRSFNHLSSQIEASNLANPVLEDRDNGKFLKYTFQRRRKKGKLSFSDGNSTADNIPKMEIDEECNDSQETSLFDLTSESSGHTQLMEVAEQLITLSRRT